MTFKLHEGHHFVVLVVHLTKCGKAKLKRKQIGISVTDLDFSQFNIKIICQLFRTCKDVFANFGVNLWKI